MADPDWKYMRLAIRQAEDCRPEDGRPHPKVGVVVVKAGKILTKAYRGELQSGQHAEFTAMEIKLQRRALAGATVYTTLEPCTTRNHPKVPCAQRLIEHKVKRVFIGMLDPNSTICGKGVRQLEEANIDVVHFPKKLRALVEEQNRDFTREQKRKAAGDNVSAVSWPNGIQPVLVPPNDVLIAAGLTAFYPSREFYVTHRSHASTIDKYVATAKRTVIMVGVNLQTGLPFDGLCRALARKLETQTSPFSATISLLDYRSTALMEVMAPLLGMSKSKLKSGIRDSVRELARFRAGLSSSARKSLKLRLHRTIPFGSAILIDHLEPTGRIQIETKPYGAPIRQSFAFEIGPHGTSGLYEAVASGYEALVNDGDEV